MLILIITLICVGIPVAFALGLTSIVIFFQGNISFLTMPIRMFNGADNLPLLAVPLFILTGAILGESGIAQRLINFAAALVGFIRGGLAHVNILTSMFFAEMSGSAVADAASLGKIFIPGMKSKGYPEPFSAAVTSASAVIGIIIPPSIPLIIYGSVAGASISALFIAGILPGVLLGISLMVVSYIIARAKSYPVERTFIFSEVWRTFRESCWAFSIPVIILGGILGGIFTPTEAAGVAVLVSLILGFFVYRGLTVRDMKRILLVTVKQTAVVMMLVATCAVLSWYLANEQIPQKIAQSLLEFTHNPYLILLLLNFFILIMGMFFQAAAALILVVPIIMPILSQIGIDPVHFGIIMTLNLAIGQQTPPVATVLITVSAVSELPMMQVFYESRYFLLASVIVLFLVTYFPWIPLYLPSLLVK